MKIACALLLLALSPCLRAQEGDPLKSPACGAALAQLQAARNGDAAADNVGTLRSAAAGACLGSATPPTRPGRVLQAPVVVPPPQIDVPQRVTPLPPPVLPPPPVAIDHPPAPALCDASGCWTTDGTHLRLVPPTLVGPRGLCTPQAGQLLCP